VIARALGRGESWLGPADVWAVLSCYGLPIIEQRVCEDEEDVNHAARDLGGSLALKAVAPGLVHKTEKGGVRVGLAPEQAAPAAREVRARLGGAGAEIAGFVLQRMAPAGLEMIVGAVQDPQFGPVLACGAGGTMVELLKDVAVRIAPLADRDAREMLAELRTYPALTGYRGAIPRDVDALVDVVLRTGRLVDDLPEIQELDLNPVIVHDEVATIVDARIRVAAVERGPGHDP
jgi:acyl-CoA synthetase (NDP forming)